MDAVVAGFQPRDGQQPLDELVQTLGFEFDAVERALGIGGRTLPGQPQGHAEPRQGRAEFMGNIFQQARLRLHQAFNALGHAVEIAHQFGQFITPVPHGGAGAGAQVTRRQPLRRLPQARHRTGQGPCQ